MTNKTIALSRELACPFCGSKELKQVTDDGIHFTQCKSCEATGPTGFKRGEDDAVDWNTRAALADPVPPAGGAVEVVAWANWKVGTKSYIPFRSKEEASRSVDKSELAAIQLGPYKVVGLVDRAHVTQLKAEMREMDAENDRLLSANADLQSELTKARELIGDMVKQQVEAGTDYTADVGRAKAYLSNQSAPADKGQGEPVGLQHMAVAEDGKLRWMSGRKMQNCELYALPDGSPIRFPLYSEQPAPVAVILPKRIAADDLNEIAQGWNCCLDAVERLNP